MKKKNGNNIKIKVVRTTILMQKIKVVDYDDDGGCGDDEDDDVVMTIIIDNS